MKLEINWPKAGRYVVAVSGGLDSLALLRLLRAKGGYELIVAHVDHGMRPEAGADRRLVAHLAASYGLRFECYRAHLGSEASEDEARRARYGYLHQLSQQLGAAGIITAHHLDDRIETSLFNVARGANRLGLAPLHDQPGLHRPLLNITRQQLQGYARQHKLEWSEDATNLDLARSRNYIRHVVLPRMSRTQVKAYAGMLARTDRLNREVDALLESLTTRHARKAEAGWEVDSATFAALDEVVAKHWLHFLLRQMTPDGEFTQLNLKQLLELAGRSSPQTLHLPGGTRARVAYGKLQLHRGLLPGDSQRWEIYESAPQEAEVVLPGSGWSVRTWQPGDRIRLSFGTKKLQDLFVDAKIDRDKRKDWPVVVDRTGTILWVPKLAQAQVPLKQPIYLRSRLSRTV